MNARQLLARIRTDVDGVATDRQIAISTSRLQEYLADLDAGLADGSLATSHPVEGAPTLRDNLTVAQYKSSADALLELSRATNANGQAAIRASLTVNGAAAIALLAFTGHVVTASQSRLAVDALAQPMALFMVGVLLAAVAFGVTYVTAALFCAKRFVIGNVSNAASVLLIIASYIVFAVAGYFAYSALRVP